MDAFTDMKDQERLLTQEIVNKIHRKFMDHVIQYRKDKFKVSLNIKIR